jgi:ABC-type cobalamin transport system ATPase subunit
MLMSAHGKLILILPSHFVAQSREIASTFLYLSQQGTPSTGEFFAKTIKFPLSYLNSSAYDKTREIFQLAMRLRLKEKSSRLIR